MIPELGHFALVVALFIGLALATLPVIGASRGDLSWMQLARPAAQSQFLFVALAFVALMSSFVNNDFSVVNVATNSNSELPLPYRMAATWGSHEGSMLLWVFMLAGWAGVVSTLGRRLPADMLARVLGVMSFIATGMLLFILFTSNPFMRLVPPALEGRELQGRLRELSPVSDPASRTYPMRLTLRGPMADLQWGMTAVASVAREGDMGLFVPLSALYSKDGQPHLWRVDTAAQTVRLTPIKTGGLVDERVRVVEGIQAGDRVVTAGAKPL